MAVQQAIGQRGGQRGNAPALPATPAPSALARQVPPREKAAIIVRLLLAEGASIPLASLPDHMQTALAEQMARMRLVDRATLGAVVEEFLHELDSAGLAFPGGIEGALGMMDGHISPAAASRLKRLAAATTRTDPWERIAATPPDLLLPLIAAEAPEVAAVVLSKLPVPRAAELLAMMEGERARRVAYAVSLTAGIGPEPVRRIGQALAQALDAQPRAAFDAGPADRVGAILNVAPSATREAVLEGLRAEDAAFADRVARAILTFAHLPARLNPRDVPRVLRLVEPPRLVTALAAAQGKPALTAAADFLLANVSGRMAEGLREDMVARGAVKEREGEEAMAAVMTAVRQLEAAGELVLKDIEGG
jgi:flagellar motor switch protein FliG